VFQLLPTMRRTQVIRSSLSLVLALTILLLGCSQVPPARLVGNYEAKFAFGTESLRLGSDGTYSQALTLANAKDVVSNTGHWEYAQSRELVILHEPLLFDNNFGKLNPGYRTPVNGSWNLNVRRTFGGIRLTWNDDMGVVLRKVD
jgi:hypothetical protein